MPHSHSSSTPRPAASLFWSAWQRVFLAALVLFPIWALLLWSMN